jgi:Holliday junction DNA helicase RuvA
VGPKLAQRIVHELKDKAPAVMALGGALSVDTSGMDEVIEPSPAPRKPTALKPQPSASASATAEALSALINLGYGQGEAASAVAEASGVDEGATTPTLIRAALKLLAPKG